MDEKITRLKTLGAAEIEHLDGPFLDHLVGTKEMLKSWSAPEVLQNAGLYHAAYGTVDFGERFSTLEKRQEIAKIIGEESEALVYLYCSCDRHHFWSQIGIAKTLEFRNRFTNETYQITEQELRDFCELTVANELEIATDNPDFIKKNGERFFDLFERMQPYLSANAIQAYKALLA
tara:strand:+ start:416 stop:943 length:528 start_codon:yes stop_codon:yes gene_type:complete